MTSFLIADDHAITRMGVVSYIKDQFSPCTIEEAEDGDEVFSSLKSQAFDILITDMIMPGTDSYRLIDTALLIQPNLKILVLSMNKEELFAASYLKKGAMGFVEKNSISDEIIKAIKTVLDGDIYMSPNMRKSLVSGHGVPTHNPFSKLSGRELEICQLLCQGKAVTEIASVLSLGISTVGTHKARIFTKLGIDNMIDLVKISQTYPLST